MPQKLECGRVWTAVAAAVRVPAPMATTDTVRNDRVLPETRWASMVVFLILVPALIVLWGMPDETADLWAWTIMPELTPIFMGAGYGAGAYFFFQTWRAERWHPSSAGVFGAAFFASLMLIATLIHWDKFNKGDAPFLAAFCFYAWVIVYILSPFVVMWLWWRNHQRDPRTPEPGDPVVPEMIRLGARVFAVGALVAAAVFFISPETAIDVWPWPLTELTARVLASFTAQVGVGALLLSMDSRWSSWRLLLQTFFVATVLLLIGAIRESDDFIDGRVTTWLYVGGLIAADLALALLYARMERLRGAVLRGAASG